MPALSVAQRRLMAIALHHPELIKKKNRGVLNMKKEDLEDFALTPERGLKEHVLNLTMKGKLKTRKRS